MVHRTIISGLKINYNKYFNIQFGEYFQTHYSHDNNTGNSCTIIFLDLLSTINHQGGYFLDYQY